MARFIEIEDIRGHRIAINVDYIQTIRDVTDEPTFGNTGILLNNDIVQTNLEYSKVIELIRSNPKKERIPLMAVTSNEPKVIATSRYSINETCELLGITRKTLQKYTMFGLIKCGFRKATMKKFYTGLEIIKFWRAAV